MRQREKRHVTHHGTRNLIQIQNSKLEKKEKGRRSSSVCHRAIETQISRVNFIIVIHLSILSIPSEQHHFFMFVIGRRATSVASRRLYVARPSVVVHVKALATTQEAQIVSERPHGALWLRQQQELEELERKLNKSLEEYQRLLSKSGNTAVSDKSVSLIGALHKIANCYEDLEYWDEALRIEEEIRKQILNDKESSTLTSNEQLAASSYRIGKLHHRQEKWQLAHRYYDEALELHRDQVKRGQVYISIAGIHFHRGDYQKALQTLQEQAEPCFPPHDMGLFKCIQHEGLIYRTLENFEEALNSYQKASEILEMQESIDDTIKRELDLDTADMLTACDHLDEALGLYVDILERTRNCNDFDDEESQPFEAVILHNIGKIHARKGELEEAVGNLSRAVDLKEHWLGEFHPELGKTLSALGAVYGVVKEKQKALQCFQKALLIARMHADDEDDPDVFLALRNIGVLKGEVNQDKTNE
jgi:tetratricopeptide (TPR) repeat protein